MGAFLESSVVIIFWKCMYLSFVLTPRCVEHSASFSLCHVSVPGSADYVKR